ncbi:MAG TPA: hypothetical protein VN408_33910 [Actinoplanes sp.]|nr:hypothetical protein [Actinoplanes sp.]
MTDAAVYGVDSFLEPRRALPTGGRLTDFREWKVTGRTEILGDIAQHSCRYAKPGTLDGAAVSGEGFKIFPLLRTPTGWRITAVSWHDD